MQFVLHCTDKPGSLSLRIDTRPAHVDYLNEHRENVYIAGPTFDDDGENPNGSLLVIDFPNLAAAEAFAAADPYARAGLFESVVIKPWKMTFEPQS